ncbi:bifunctional helix-turn-helix transcriptional regulator/GNAT family N-acetyltransferase [Flagellimonas myxillae]|uniref:bifunctional helix-turn-helix transcriptional regulator/GNAT family N-acetyltransferase n=1 Tax=Flagellimonas myxillae TaxID=2942214 RepID=UPI00201EEB5D|nr:bifunctional helix-turn-helix transcriptional regulator/GNAT family N-acetyltransferase [Muricauda myxillae]MCL6267653.1 bifunctional helix-turn-helix transcriptional regulator/GNAT family N-acetyltransferase [Muricauda myxillae]
MTDILNELGFLAGASRFRRISEKLQQDGDKIYSDANIQFKASWFSVYYVLAKSDSPQTILEISNQIDFSHITVKNILRELKREELVSIKPNPNDKRSKLVELTTKGKALQKELEPLWLSFSNTLKDLFSIGHPDMINILNRLDWEINNKPINERIHQPKGEIVKIIDYKPGLKKYFYELAGPWLLGVLNGELEEEDKFTLNNPDKAYLENGGFLFYAKFKSEIVGCVALKRLDDDTFEFAKLFIDPNHRKLGIGTKLIERCISRCLENDAKELWLQTTMSMPQAHKLYYKLGFNDKLSPPQMDVLERTEKVMCLSL